MNPETEKLEDALKVEAAFGNDFPSWAEMDDAFSEKYGEKYCVVIEQAARRYAEVLPLLEAFDEYADRMITYREEDIARLDDADRDTFFHAARHEAVILTLEEVAALLKRDKIAAIAHERGEG